jgi:hypothetical protein
MLVLRRVGVGSAFKVGFMLNGLLALVFGLIAFLLQVAFLNTIMSGANFDVYTSGQTQTTIDTMRALSLVGTGTLCFFYAMAVVFGAVFGGIGFAILAFAYNVTARMVGGLELETISSGAGLLDEIEAEIYNVEKRKRY